MNKALLNYQTNRYLIDDTDLPCPHVDFLKLGRTWPNLAEMTQAELTIGQSDLWPKWFWPN